MLRGWCSAGLISEAVRTRRVAELGVEGRAKWVRRYGDWLLDNESRLTDALSEEVGKPRPEASIEVLACADAAKYFGSNAASFLATDHPAVRQMPIATATREREWWKCRLKRKTTIVALKRSSTW